MESLTLSNPSSPAVGSIREKLASQISSSPVDSPGLHPVSSEDHNVVKNEDDVEVDKELESIQNIDDIVDIDPLFILEDETSRNTQFNSLLYDQEEDSSTNLVPDTLQNDEFLDKYRLMESTSSLSLNNTSDSTLKKPQPLRPSTLTFSQSPLSSSTVVSPVISKSGTPIRSNLKSPLSTPRPALLRNSSNYEKRILFDTLSNMKASNLQMILKTKHKDYKFTRISRTFLCGYDDHEYSETALKWVVDELMDDGDMIVCLRVINKEDLNPQHNYQLENEKIMERILQFNKSNKKISILLEISVSSKVSKKIMQAIKDYEPSLLIVGSSGVPKKGFKNIISPKSMSKYCLQYSDIPVIVVKPTYKPLFRTKSCITIRKVAREKPNQSLDTLVMSDSDNDDEEDEEEIVDIDENYYKKLLTSYTSLSREQGGVKNEERPTRAARPRSSIFPRLLTPQRSHGNELTPTNSGTSELLRPTRSRGLSPVRSLSPFWRKKEK